MRHLTRLFTPLLAIALAVGLGPVSPAAAAPGQPARAKSAATWLVSQTNAHGQLESFTGYGDLGLTLDGVMALVAAKAPQASVTRMLKGAERGFKERVMEDPANDVERNNGLIGKALVSLAAARRDTSSFDGINPRSLALASVTGSSPAGYAKGTNMFGQAFVMIGVAAETKLPVDTVTFLASRQCPDGSFPLELDVAPCSKNPQKGHPDGTAMAVMALRAAKAQAIPAADAPLKKAVAWLQRQQDPSGGFTGLKPFNPSLNTNSTGLIAGALAGIDDAALARAGAFTAKLQLTNGAIAYDQDAYDAGLTPIATGQWVRATAQALFAFAAVDLFPVAGGYMRTAPYSLPGNHTVDGRKWRTTCQPYSRTERCRSEIWATVVTRTGATYQRTTGWAFNNLTYLPYMSRAEWSKNPLGHAGTFTGTDGRPWRTECDTAATGRGACRSYARVTVYDAKARPSGGYDFSQSSQFVFNNMVLFNRQ